MRKQENVIKGVKFIDLNTGFLCYEYNEDMESNLYRTTDGEEHLRRFFLKVRNWIAQRLKTTVIKLGLMFIERQQCLRTAQIGL